MAETNVPSPPLLWDYTDYRKWLSDTFQARKAAHSWYSYGVLASRAGFKARDFLLRVMRGERNLSSEGAEKLAAALELSRKECEYFLALVRYNQAKSDRKREDAWTQVEQALAKVRDVGAPRLLNAVHRQIQSHWHALALRSLLEMRPDPGDCAALGSRLHPPQTAATVRHDIALLERGGLLEKQEDGLWHATEKAIATSPEVGAPAVRQFHRKCLELASQSLESVPVERRNISGITLGISAQTYDRICQRLQEVREEFSRLADADNEADEVFQLTFAFFPFSQPASEKEAS